VTGRPQDKEYWFGLWWSGSGARNSSVHMPIVTYITTTHYWHSLGGNTSVLLLGMNCVWCQVCFLDEFVHSYFVNTIHFLEFFCLHLHLCMSHAKVEVILCHALYKLAVVRKSCLYVWYAQHAVQCWIHTVKDLVQETKKLAQVSCTSILHQILMQISCTRKFQNRNSWNLLSRWHQNNNNLTALHKTEFTLPLTSPLRVLCFSILCKSTYKFATNAFNF